MRAVVFEGKERIAVKRVDPPSLQHPLDALVRVHLAGICGSDLHLYHGKIPVLPGSILGHEFVGQVEAVGEGIPDLRPGDWVVGPFHIACGTCTYCRRQQYNLCERGGVYGYGPMFGNLQGAQTELLRVPFANVNLRKLPPNLSPERAIFAGDILSTAYGGLIQGQFRPGDSVAVIGAGPVGLMAIEVAQALGASKVLAIDRIPERLERAAALGAIPINAERENPVRRARSETNDEGPDLVVEAVGGTTTLSLALEMVRPGGRVSAVGVDNAPSFPFPLASALVKDLTFRIGLANVHLYIDTVLALLASGRLQPEKIISHYLPLEEAPRGYELFDRKEALKVLLVVRG
jgi:2-desacetyl-2-hydroxyethyl bacteriochlorophyllide A dehydrogenase